MPDSPHPASERESLLDAIRQAAGACQNERLTRQRFLQMSGRKLADVFRHFPKWSDALSAAGVSVDAYNQKIGKDELLRDWAELVRQLRHIPTRNEYKLEGSYSATVFERNFGPWSSLPSVFRDFAATDPAYADVLTLLPHAGTVDPAVPRVTRAQAHRHTRLDGRPMYGDPIDFRGFRHAPVNEQGVVFLFGVVARELGYLVEAVQSGFPDCEAKRQVAPGKWQRVRIEFEYDSRHFLEHGHDVRGCDVIVCWTNGWSECPIEVLELSTVIASLPKDEE